MDSRDEVRTSSRRKDRRYTKTCFFRNFFVLATLDSFRGVAGL
jgi:hypothetical protein